MRIGYTFYYPKGIPKVDIEKIKKENPESFERYLQLEKLVEKRIYGTVFNGAPNVG